MSGWWVHDVYNNAGPVILLSWIFWVLLSIILHELAHGWAAILEGDQTPRQLQRMTMNPVVHMGWWSLGVFALAGIAWGAMPVDPSRFRHGRFGRILVALAGPAMNLAIALVVLTVAGLIRRFGPESEIIQGNLVTFLVTGGWLNLLLCMLNLLPVPPLDGSNVMAGLFGWYRNLMRNPNVQMGGMLILIVVVFSGFGAVLFGTAQLIGVSYVNLVAGPPAAMP